MHMCFPIKLHSLLQKIYVMIIITTRASFPNPAWMKKKGREKYCQNKEEITTRYPPKKLMCFYHHSSSFLLFFVHHKIYDKHYTVALSLEKEVHTYFFQCLDILTNVTVKYPPLACFFLETALSPKNISAP